MSSHSRRASKTVQTGSTLVLLTRRILVLFVVMTAGCALRNTAQPTETITSAVGPSCCTETITPAAGPSCCLDTSTPVEPHQTPTASPSLRPVLGHSRGYLTTPQELETIKRKADQGLAPYASAVPAALAYAQDAYQAGEIIAPGVIDIQDQEVA